MENPKPLTVVDIVEEMKKSQGYAFFVTLLVKKEDGSLNLEHRYMRQQFFPGDLKSSFEGFQSMIKQDVVSTGSDLIQAAETIANMKSPIDATGNVIKESTEEHEGAKDTNA